MVSYFIIINIIIIIFIIKGVMLIQKEMKNFLFFIRLF